MEFFKKLFRKEEQQINLDPHRQVESAQSENQEEEVTSGTKIKVVAALFVVGFAAYVAYWIQEPVEVRTDLLGSGTTMEAGTQGTSEVQAGTTQEVSIVNFSFNPATLNVTKGTTVIWTNKDTVPHTVVGDDFNSQILNPGDSFTFTFDTEGSFAYKCSLHPQMKGFVIVGTAAGEATKDQVLSGFGAGSSLGLDTTTTATTEGTQNQATTQEAAPVEAPSEQAATPPEQIYTTTAPAPALPLEELHNAALQSLSSSLSNVGNVAATPAESAQGSTPLTAEQQAAAAQTAAQAAASASAQKGKLASSGPEDFLYAGIFGIILYLNRKKLGKLQKSLR